MNGRPRQNPAYRPQAITGGNNKQPLERKFGGLSFCDFFQQRAKFLFVGKTHFFEENRES